jgi:hypothetical protein
MSSRQTLLAEFEALSPNPSSARCPTPGTGYSADVVESQHIGGPDPRETIQRILANRPHSVRKRRRCFLLEIRGDERSNATETSLFINFGGDVSVTPRRSVDTRPGTCTVRVDLAVLTDVIFGNASAKSCVADGRITINPVSASFEALPILEALCVRTPTRASILGPLGRLFGVPSRKVPEL